MKTFIIFAVLVLLKLPIYWENKMKVKYGKVNKNNLKLNLI